MKISSCLSNDMAGDWLIYTSISSSSLWTPWRQGVTYWYLYSCIWMPKEREFEKKMYLFFFFLQRITIRLLVTFQYFLSDSRTMFFFVMLCTMRYTSKLVQKRHPTFVIYAASNCSTITRHMITTINGYYLWSLYKKVALARLPNSQIHGPRLPCK